MNRPSLGSLLRTIHEDERGAQTIETVLIIAAISLPILIFLYKFAWPKIREKVVDVLVDLGLMEGGGGGGEEEGLGL